MEHHALRSDAVAATVLIVFYVNISGITAIGLWGIDNNTETPGKPIGERIQNTGIRKGSD
jgi:hypothetical protein